MLLRIEIVDNGGKEGLFKYRMESSVEYVNENSGGRVNEKQAQQLSRYAGLDKAIEKAVEEYYSNLNNI